MRKIILGLIVVTHLALFDQAYASTKCPKPAPNASIGFSIIENANGRSLADFLDKNIVAKTALNERCETMYHASLRTRNEVVRNYLDSLGYGPSNAEQVNAANEKLGLNFFEYALVYGKLSAVNDLRRRGGVLSKAFKDDKISELMLAAQGNTKEVFLDLVRRGADVNDVDKGGFSALSYASSRNSKRNVEALLRLGADINATSSTERSALMIAAVENTKDVVELLIHAGADVSSVDEDGFASLHYAAFGGNSKEVVELLIKYGASKQMKTARSYWNIPVGSTAYDIAVIFKRGEDILNLLKP